MSLRSSSELNEEPFWQEKPEQSTPDDSGDGTSKWGGGSGGEGSGTGGGVVSWGGGGGGGGGGDGENVKWSILDFPYLKTCATGSLLCDWKSGHLLIGTYLCDTVPHVLIAPNGEKGKEHFRCLLWRMEGDENSFSASYLDSKSKFAHGFFKSLRPGNYTFLAKWQSGHYEHAQVPGAEFKVFGVDLGDVVLPLKHWREVFTLKITADYSIYVNFIRGAIRGNEKWS